MTVTIEHRLMMLHKESEPRNIGDAWQ